MAATTMKKRTIQPAAGYSRVTPEEAKAAARFVYRDRATGKLIVTDRHPSEVSKKR